MSHLNWHLDSLNFVPVDLNPLENFNFFHLKTFWEPFFIAEIYWLVLAEVNRPNYQAMANSPKTDKFSFNCWVSAILRPISFNLCYNFDCMGAIDCTNTSGPFSASLKMSSANRSKWSCTNVHACVSVCQEKEHKALVRPFCTHSTGSWFFQGL